MEKIVVIGAGHAAGQLVDALRTGGSRASIVLVGEEPFPPYQRPPLSKKYLAGEMARERLLFRPESFYTRHGVEREQGRRVVALDRDDAAVELDDGRSLPFDRLALCTGARVRRLALPGADLAGVHYLRSIAEADGLRQDWQQRSRVCIVGGGFIGLEVAAVARTLGKQVTLLEQQDRLMPRAVPRQVSDFYLALHRERGVDVRLGTTVRELLGKDGRVSAVACQDGSAIPADLVVVGIGVLPNSELAQQAGLACDNGVLVDEFACTADRRIVAAGDCTNHPNALLGRRLRLESVHNAVEQARTAAASLLGSPRAYRQHPWFWSDQFEFKLQMVGLSEGHDLAVSRGNARAGKFAVYYFQGQRLLAVDAVNSPADHMLARKLLAAGISPSAGQVSDPDFDLRSLL